MTHREIAERIVERWIDSERRAMDSEHPGSPDAINDIVTALGIESLQGFARGMEWCGRVFDENISKQKAENE